MTWDWIRVEGWRGLEERAFGRQVVFGREWCVFAESQVGALRVRLAAVSPGLS